MQVDKTTLDDLSIFAGDDMLSIFHHLNFTKTNGGREWLRIMLSNVCSTQEEINEMQTALKHCMHILPEWPEQITNGTIMVMEKFFETPLEPLPAHVNFLNSLSYVVLNRADYSLLRYSIQHFIDFFKGMKACSALLPEQNERATFTLIKKRIQQLIEFPIIEKMLAYEKNVTIPHHFILLFGYFIRNRLKKNIVELIEIYCKLDAYCSLAQACKEYKLCFPEFIHSNGPLIEAKQLFHLLLPKPVAYDIALLPEQNFMFLTGANMAGKSTFIKALGVAVYLAHIGMGVPAAEMKLTFLDGLISNIQVTDNLSKGESYFYNEVQRIKKTLEKINDGKSWLVLIDELFKGTNVEDAMKCSTAVIEGLAKMKTSLFVLSTHLYEIGTQLQKYSNIQFRYFETIVEKDKLSFNYRLNEGISNDRLGYLILQQEGVLNLLHQLNTEH